MLTMPSFAEFREQLPEQLRQRASQIEALMFTLISCCNEALPQTDPDIVLNALLSVYCNAALETGLGQVAAGNLVKASLTLAFEAAQPGAAAAAATPSNLH